MPPLSQARIIWAGILPSHVILIGLTYFFGSAREGLAESGTPAMFGIVFLVLSFSVAAASIALRNVLLGRMGDRPPRARLQLLIVGMAVAEFPSILGFVYAMISGETTLAFIMIGCGVATHILHFPTRV